MAVGYLKENFAFGTLASTLNAAAVTLTMTAGHSLPTASGSFQLVIWDAATFPNPSDDPNVEIVTGSFDTGNAYDITRAQESTSDVEHAAGQKVGLHYTAGVNVDDLDASNHPMARVSGSTFSTVQHAQDIFHSAGWISGGAVTDDGDGTITVALGTGLIRATDSATAQILYFDWASEAGANVALVDNDISYVYVEYNGGSPQVIATITQRTDFNKNVLLASVSREGTDVHVNQTDQHTVGDHANSMIRRLVGVQPYGRVSGGILSETGTRNIAVTAGDFWRGLTEFTTSAVDTSGAPTFSYYYNSGAGWQKVAAVSDIHQTNYNNFGVGLATLDNNKYGVHWVYIEADDDDIAVVYGIGNYTLSQAEDAQPPSAVPQHLQMEGILAGKIIIGKGDAAFTQVESAFETKFVGSIATDHADLASLAFASAGHTGFQAQGDILDDLNTLTAATVDGQFIVATGAGAFAYESTTTARTSLGVGEGDSPTLTGLVTTGQISSAVGTEGSPGFAFTGQLDDGMWSPTPGELAWSISGSEAMRLDGNITLENTYGYAIKHTTGSELARFHLFSDNEFYFDNLIDTTSAINFRVRNASTVRNRLRINNNGDVVIGAATPGGNFGIGETSPETAIEITTAAPYITLHNETSEDTDGGGESRLIFKREQSGGEETACAQIEASHDGAIDDQLGKLVLSINTGAALAPGLTIDSSGNIIAGAATISDNSGNLTSANGASFGPGAVSSITVLNGIVTVIS